jgi:carboxylate-amine ligase
VIFRFDRRALEIRVMDEQECVKSDVALSCFIRALARGSMAEEAEFLSRGVLVRNYNAIVRGGLDAGVQHPQGPTARQVCKSLLKVAWENATVEEKNYLLLIEKRIEQGSLSEVIRERVKSRSQKTDFGDAVVDVYSKLIRSLIDNEPYF